MIEIFPAIMPNDFDDLRSKLLSFRGIAKKVQIDVMDGVYVPSQSWPYIGDLENNFQEIVHGEEGMPYWQDFDFYIDLMIKNSKEKIDNWMKAGATGIIIHNNSVDDAVSLAKEVKEQYGDYIDLGVAYGSQENINNIEEILPNIDFVQCMGIENIGYQGEEFDPNVLKQIRYIRSIDTDIPIMVDGSINEETIDSVVKAGADRLAIGSALEKSEDKREKYQHFTDLIS